MTKLNYNAPEAQVMKITWQEPLCVVSGEIPDYDPIDNPGFNAPLFDGFEGLI